MAVACQESLVEQIPLLYSSSDKKIHVLWVQVDANRENRDDENRTSAEHIHVWDYLNKSM